MSIPYGKKIGIVGETGSGKSILLKTLVRIRDITDGSITIDGHDIYKQLPLISCIGNHDALDAAGGYIQTGSYVFDSVVNSPKNGPETNSEGVYYVVWNNVLFVVLDSEVQFIQPDNPDNPDNPSTGDGSALSTEDGRILLTEDGLVILLDGAISSDILADAILTEMGYVILTENGKQILKG